MTSTAELPSPVVSTGTGDEPVHIACAVTEKSWCGAPCDEWVTKAPSLDDVCRICLMVMEMVEVTDRCPICHTRECLDLE